MVINMEVTLEECNGNFEVMIRRFLKKVKNSGIMQEYKEHTYYIKPSQKKNEKKRSKRK